jgi:hypothetical protein
MVICPNCHRALNYKGPKIEIKSLAQLMREHFLYNWADDTRDKKPAVQADGGGAK